MKTISVISAVYNEELNIIEVVKEIVHDDDSIELNLHTFDPEALEWRSVIYGIEDQDELVDIILYEPYIEDVKPLGCSIEVARDRCRQRISEVKQNHQPNKSKNGISSVRPAGLPQKYTVSTVQQAYAAIKNNSLFHPMAMEAKQEFVESQRSANAQPKNRPNNNERAQMIKNKLDRMKGREPVPEQPVKDNKSKDLPPIIMERRKNR